MRHALWHFTGHGSTSVTSCYSPDKCATTVIHRGNRSPEASGFNCLGNERKEDRIDRAPAADYCPYCFRSGIPWCSESLRFPALGENALTDEALPFTYGADGLQQLCAGVHFGDVAVAT